MTRAESLKRLHALAQRAADPEWARTRAFPYLHYGREAANCARAIATARGPEDDWIVRDVSAQAVTLAKIAFRSALGAVGLKRL
jgi:hypothetical protein